MFGKKKRQKKRQMKKELRDFKCIVSALLDGVHKLDEFIQHAKTNNDCRFSTAEVIIRSIQDITSTCNMYKENIFFHGYMIPIVSESANMLGQLGLELENLCRDLSDSYSKFKLFTEKIDHETEDGDIDPELFHEYQEKMFKFHHLISGKISNINSVYTYIQSALLSLRVPLSRDYMTILSGVDMIQAYETHELSINREMDAIVSFDKFAVKRLKATPMKESDLHV